MDTKVVDTEIEEVGAVDTGDTESLSSVYEIGYHLLPTLSEEEVPQVVSSIMDSLKAEGATFVGERFPSQIELAYPIAKRVASKKTNYESAYFGWVAFEVSRDAILRMKNLLDGNVNILRYLIVVTDKDAVAAAMSGAVSAPTGTIDKPKRDAEVGGEMSEVALDQALETIATEDAKAAD
jgi:ribosomal protein S6